jgi:hypothetical protein
VTYFTQAQQNSPLFLGQTGIGTGYVAAVFPAVPPATGYEIPDVLGTTAAGAPLDASIIFLQEPVGTDGAAQSAFIAAVAACIAAQPNTERVMAWTVSPTTLPSATVVSLGAGVADGPVRTTTPLNVYANTSSNLTITIVSGQMLQATLTGIASSQSSSWPTVAGPAIVATTPFTIPFVGPNAFCLQFGCSITQLQLDAAKLGFAFAMPAASGALPPELLLYAPFCTPFANQTPIFAASFDPLDLLNAANPDRSMLAFAGNNLETTATTFQSCHTSPSGMPVTLTPVSPGTAETGDAAARLVFVSLQFSDSTPAIFMLVPEGDFVLGMPQGDTPQLMCGLQGMEYFQFTPAATKIAGDRLRYVSGSPAYAPQFPFPIASPTAAPFDPTASPLTTTWTTSYATLRQPVGGEAVPPMLVAQPPGFQLFSPTGAIPSAHPKLLGSVAPGVQIGALPTHPFPLVPYLRAAQSGSTTMSAQQIAAFEAGVMSPLRSTAVAQDALPPSSSGTETWFVTPAGYLVEANYDPQAGTATWTKILLGMVGTQEISFTQPTPALVNAFGSGNLMLVVANAGSLVTPQTGVFANTLTIGDWTMSANVGDGDTFGDYTNLVIVKGMTGALSDLVRNPANWTSAATFASPVTASGGTPDVSQLVNVGQWLQTYFAEAAAVTGPDAQYFAEFNTLAADPNWTGVLILRADITGIPQDIAGILAGITDYSQFNAHHLAIPMVPATTPPTPQQSPVLGLIYYNPYPATPPAQAVATDPTEPYGFQLNSLKVTFQNSDVQTFSSYAQITMRAMLGSTVAKSAAGYDSVVLTGTYQLVDSQPVYSMASTADTTFELACAVLPAVDITGVQMSTVSVDPTGNTVSAFSIVGYLDFAILPGAVTNPPGTVDLFSFGRDPGSEDPAGLTFQNLVLTMTFPTPTGSPTPVAAAFVLSNAAMRFDIGTSHVRAKSLVQEFALQVTSLVQYPSSTTPASLGYLPVIAMIPGGNLGDNWNALLFNLDMGTPGQLAAKAGLTSSLMLAWNPGSMSSDPWGMQIGLQLPGTSQGAPLISLQTVLSLSIGQVSLQYALTADGTSSAFLLMLNEIAISFLGLLKFPPNGATSFYLFGDPAGTGQQSSLGWYASYVNTGGAT